MQTITNMLFLSTFYMSFAVGLAMIFGIMRTINYAHGEFYMLGGYILLATYSLLSGIAAKPIIFVIALAGGAIAVGLAGALVERFIVEPLKDNPFSIFMATLGLSYALQVVVIKIAGPVGKSVPPLFTGVLRVAGTVVPYQRLAVLLLTLLFFGLLWAFLTHSATGRAIRAAAQNRTGARLQGIGMRRISLITMVIGSGLAGLSGVLMGSVISVSPFMGGEAIWFAFIVIIVGGIGSLPGAVLAAFFFGVLNTLLTSQGFGDYVGMADAVIMLVILAILPNGLMGVRE